MTEKITIAIAKGRIFKEAIPLFKDAGIELVDDPDVTRKLILETNQDNIRIIIIRAADVPTYVEYGSADLGIVGKDVLMEYSGNGLYEPLDLKIACCKMVLAALKKTNRTNRRSRVATKYVNITRNFFASQGKQVEIIKLYGSMELAPVLDLADQIVDLVDTGNTLKANGLVPIETITEISSRVVVNKASMKMKNNEIQSILNKLSKVAGKS